jgi:hypothetical protein
MKSLKVALFVFFISFGIQAQELASGKATLTRKATGNYEISKTDGTTKTVNIRPNEDAQTRGILAVLFQDCEEVRQKAATTVGVSEAQLVQWVKDYNNCDYAPYQPTEGEVKAAANFQGDKMKLFASLGASLNRISFFNFDDYENLTQGQASFGIAATPGFLGTLQGNLYFTLEASAALSGEKDFGNSPFKTNFKKNSFRASFGGEYHFNKNGSFQPLVGIAIGLVRDQYKGSYDIYELDQTEGSAFFMPKVGVLFPLDSKKSLGVILSYIPEYENDLTFRSGDEIIPLTIDSHYLNAGLYLYF